MGLGWSQLASQKLIIYVRVSLNRVHHCPKELINLDDFDKVSVSSLLDGLNAEEEAPGLTGGDNTGAFELMEVPAVKQGEN